MQILTIDKIDEDLTDLELDGAKNPLTIGMKKGNCWG
jgi:hypothetical protein